MWIINSYWLIALYLFISLVRNKIFLIVKKSTVGEELSDVNKSLCNNILLVSLRLCNSPLVRFTFQLTLSPCLPFLQQPWNVRGRQFTSRKFTGNRKTQIIVYVYIYIAHHLQGQWKIPIS